ncbi:uncharacterized protein GGS25DRAFT_265102 [Hypoxylon fragiforme]|uniref:uncharacterized protein n=1 Tax=Hypoxylon fragiforme TaxID=63214 RepID=UPI0020C70805|nr:uncharacterized protein GGS25DRAFT_265102 [Hypoxylon fragiforme]KAI2608202.1 hypothetical protein GGS25DRAFT_265102 [Hypoxylon fragiforme]
MVRSMLFLVSAIVVVGAALVASQRTSPSVRDVCLSQDSPNQHATSYPDFISGNLNGTLLIIPIPLDAARQVIPKEYGIVEGAYRALLPSFPRGMYPMMAQIVHDHDLQIASYNISVEDFSVRIMTYFVYSCTSPDSPTRVQRAAFEFPFIDLLGDGHSSFRWAGTSIITALNPSAIEGSEGYGVTVHPGVFDPPCDPYRSLPNGTMYSHAQSSSSTGDIFMTIASWTSLDTIPYPMDFIQNITTQPVFADPQLCDNYLRLYNTTLTTGETAPVPVRGTVTAKLEPFADTRVWQGVYGWRLATPFLEPLAPSECKAS